MRARLRLVLLWGGAAVLAGLLYAGFVNVTGRGIPCLFYLYTGLKCPGCGVTHMCAALLRLDFAAAFASHPMLFALSPVLAVLFARGIFCYVKKGVWRPGRLETWIIWGCVFLLVGFAAVRNFL